MPRTQRAVDIDRSTPHARPFAYTIRLRLVATARCTTRGPSGVYPAVRRNPMKMLAVAGTGLIAIASQDRAERRGRNAKRRILATLALSMRVAASRHHADALTNGTASKARPPASAGTPNSHSTNTIC